MSLIIYRQLIQPVDALASAAESIREKDFSMKMLKVGYYEMDLLIDVYNLMIDQLRNERLKLQEQHFFLEKLIRAAPSGIIIFDLNGKIISINPAAERFTGSKLSDIEGKHVDDIPNKIFQKIARLQVGSSQVISISGIQTYKLEKVNFVDRGFNHFFVIIEKLTDEINNSQKKAYTGVIRMMSHEINNSIGAVNSILKSSMDFFKKPEPDRGENYREAIDIAIQRNEHLNRFMNNFAEVVRLPHPKFKIVDLNDLLNKIFKLISAELTEKHLKLIPILKKGSFPIRMDANQMEQVLVNIVKNAMEASEVGGKIEVITENEPNRKLIIRDFGKGIPAKIQEKLFTPFFSTKENGQGIGLTLTREILLNHGFGFSLQTVKANVTEFIIDFSNKTIS